MAKPPKRKYKSLDDDEDVTNLMEVIETIETEKEDDGELTPDDAVNADGEIVEMDDVQVSTAGEDDTVSVSLTSVRTNAPPPKNWADGIKTKFKIGELVYIKGTPTSIFKVSGPYTNPQTYVLRPSGCDAVRDNIPEEKIKKAPPGAKWVDYWETIVDPYRDWKRKQEAAKLAAEKPKPTKGKKKK
jgi:hypothetical protein